MHKRQKKNTLMIKHVKIKTKTHTLDQKNNKNWISHTFLARKGQFTI